MNLKTKNALIGGLLAIVFVMAVGYAAFAQQLTINGTASISSTWDVHFVEENDPDVTGTPGVSGATAPTGSISYTDGYNASITANLIQPGDSITFTLTIENGGNISADLGTPTVTMSGDEDGTGNLTATKGNIKFTVTSPAQLVIGEGETTTMTVVAEFIDQEGNTAAGTESATVEIGLNATQA